MQLQQEECRVERAWLHLQELAEVEREEEEAPVLPVAKEAGLLRLLQIRVRPPKRLLP